MLNRYWFSIEVQYKYSPYKSSTIYALYWIGSITSEPVLFSPRGKSSTHFIVHSSTKQECQHGFQSASPPKPLSSKTHLQASKVPHLTRGAINLLVEFWGRSVVRSIVGGKNFHGLDASAHKIWFVYHKAGGETCCVACSLTKWSFRVYSCAFVCFPYQVNPIFLRIAVTTCGVCISQSLLLVTVAVITLESYLGIWWCVHQFCRLSKHTSDKNCICSCTCEQFYQLQQLLWKVLLSNPKGLELHPIAMCTHLCISGLCSSHWSQAQMYCQRLLPSRRLPHSNMCQSAMSRSQSYSYRVRIILLFLHWMRYPWGVSVSWVGCEVISFNVFGSV